MNVKNDQYCATLSLVWNISLLMLKQFFLCESPCAHSPPPSLHAPSVGPSLQLSPPLCRLSLLWLRSRACEGWTSVSWLRIGPCCASSPASLSQPPCRRQRTSDPLTAAPLFSLSLPLPSTLPCPPGASTAPSSSAVFLSGRSCTLPLLLHTESHPLTPQPAWPSEGNLAEPSLENLSHNPLKNVFFFFLMEPASTFWAHLGTFIALGDFVKWNLRRASWPFQRKWKVWDHQPLKRTSPEAQTQSSGFVSECDSFQQNGLF